MRFAILRIITHTVSSNGNPRMSTGIIGLIEGIIYLTKSDEEFDATYVEGKKGWF